MLFLIILFLIDLIISDKAPFDLIESESELIDGITTDFIGIIFSLVFSYETVYFFFNIFVSITNFI